MFLQSYRKTHGRPWYDEHMAMVQRLARPVWAHPVLRMAVVASLTALGLGGCNALMGFEKGEAAADGTDAGADGPTDGGDGGGTPLDCVPSEAADAVVDACGVFVSSSLGNDSLAGTRDAPFATLGHALAEAAGRPVYGCAEEFDEALVIDAATELYGGLDCTAGWSYVGNFRRTALTAPAGSVPLVVVASATDVRVVDFAIAARPGVVAGQSSIAAIVDRAPVQLQRCTLAAGAGADGAIGGTPSSDVSGVDGERGADRDCTTPWEQLQDGGSGGQKICYGVDASGGDGGYGSSTNFGGTGEDGLPSPGGGVGGVGNYLGTGAEAGTDGVDGAPGDPGLGATGIGSISPAGYQGVAGDPGATPGVPGAGGGGGGGSDRTNCGGSQGLGASGGGGGSGGCGGGPGAGGLPGGASIALIVLSASVSLTDCTLGSAAGGQGGVGGLGQAGGLGGIGAFGGVHSAREGGDGGDGGPGGSGGGGLGGHSLGVAHVGYPPNVHGSTLISAGVAGDGGLGADGGTINTGGQGDSGQSAPLLAFD